MRSRWVTALIRTLIFLVVAHVVFLILGPIFNADIGMFRLPMIWAHWTDSWIDICIGLIASVIVYLIIYYKFSGTGRRVDGE